MQIKLSREIYNKEAVIRAAYSFTDRAYIHLDVDPSFFIVTLSEKTNDQFIDFNEFQNEVLAYLVRQEIRKSTKNIRELILARAFASTVIEERELVEPEDDGGNIQSILTDWFEKYE